MLVILIESSGQIPQKEKGKKNYTGCDDFLAFD
jgi:hypothetical protein